MTTIPRGAAARSPWRRRLSLAQDAALVVASAVACLGLVFGSVGMVVLAVVALGTSAGMWITGRRRN